MTKEKYVAYVKDNNETKYLATKAGAIGFYTVSEMELFNYTPKEFKSEMSAKRWYKQMFEYDFLWCHNPSKKYSIDDIKTLKITYKTIL